MRILSIIFVFDGKYKDNLKYEDDLNMKTTSNMKTSLDMKMEWTYMLNTRMAKGETLDSKR